jgi:hypothetical protein
MGTDKPHVTIYTNFTNYDPAYSLIRVTEDQIKMLKRHGYPVSVIVSESFTPHGVFSKDILEKIPNVPCHNEVKKDPTFEEDVASIEKRLKSIFEKRKTKACITQDIVYKPSELKHQMALRQYLSKAKSNITFLHWINSATPPITLNNLMGVFKDEYLNVFKKPIPNSYYVFFNDISRDMIAKNFNVTDDKVKIVHHPSDLDEIYGVNDENLSRFITKREVYQADAICVYPIRLDRGKQVQYPIKTMAKVKEFGMDVRMIVVDFHSSGGDKVTYRDELKQMALDEGLTPKEIAFTSDFCQDWKVNVPHEVVLSLFRMSNIFVMSSVSESYSLITQEAALNKNLIVLNQDFPPFRDIFGKDAIFRKYSSNWDVMAGYDEAYREGSHTETKYGPDNVSDAERAKTFEPVYHKVTAAKIVDKLRNDIAMAMNIRTRKYRNLDYVFKNELEQLLYL